MGVITDYLAASKVIDSTAPFSPGSKVAARELKAIIAKGDSTNPTAFAAADQVQSIAVYSGTVSGGTFTLQLTLWDGTVITTAAIAYNANAATIETAIDTAVAAVDSVHTIPVYTGTVSGGTFTLTISLPGLAPITTAAIAYDANAATIEAAIDTAVTAAGTVTGWTNGDITVALTGDLTANPATLTFDGTSVDDQTVPVTTIDGTSLTGGGSATTIVLTTPGHAPVSGWSAGDISVAGGDLTTAPVTLTFDGTSVDELNHGLVVVNGSSLTGGGSAGAVTKTTAGQRARLGYGVLNTLGILTGTFPAEGEVPTTANTQWASRDQAVISPGTIDLICKDIAITEGVGPNNNGDAIYAALVTQTDINVG